MAYLRSAKRHPTIRWAKWRALTLVVTDERLGVHDDSRLFIQVKERCSIRGSKIIIKRTPNALDYLLFCT